MALQGFPISRLNFDVIAERYGVQVKDVLGALGNSMSINALMRLRRERALERDGATATAAAAAAVAVLAPPTDLAAALEDRLVSLGRALLLHRRADVALGRHMHRLGDALRAVAKTLDVDTNFVHKSMEIKSDGDKARHQPLLAATPSAAVDCVVEVCVADVVASTVKVDTAVLPHGSVLRAEAPVFVPLGLLGAIAPDYCEDQVPIQVDTVAPFVQEGQATEYETGFHEESCDDVELDVTIEEDGDATACAAEPPPPAAACSAAVAVYLTVSLMLKGFAELFISPLVFRVLLISPSPCRDAVLGRRRGPGSAETQSSVDGRMGPWHVGDDHTGSQEFADEDAHLKRAAARLAGTVAEAARLARAAAVSSRPALGSEGTAATWPLLERQDRQADAVLAAKIGDHTEFKQDFKDVVTDANETCWQEMVEVIRGRAVSTTLPDGSRRTYQQPRGMRHAALCWFLQCLDDQNVEAERRPPSWLPPRTLHPPLLDTAILKHGGHRRDRRATAALRDGARQLQSFEQEDSDESESGESADDPLYEHFGPRAVGNPSRW
ncbi:unnamed protein product, partial [Prorocentrum cordatum]